MRPYFVLSVILLLSLIPAIPASGSCSGNDCLANAVGHFGRHVTGDNFGATTEAGEPSPCSTITSTVWYTATPRTNGTLHVSLSGNWYSTLAAYSGADMGSLTTLACSTTWYDPEGTPDDMWFPPSFDVACVADQPIRIQVGGQSGASGSFGLGLTGCAFDPTLPDTPLWCHGTFAPCLVPGVGKVTLSWYAPFWDGGQLTNIHEFALERAPGDCGAGGGFSLLATVPNSGPGTANAPTRHVDSGLVPGETWCYRVASVNVVGQGSWSTHRAAAAFPLARPPATASVEPSADGELTISWSKSPDDAPGKPIVSAYRVYAASSADGPFVAIGDTGAYDRDFAEAGLGRDTLRFYKVATINQAGVGAPGSAVSGMTPHPPSAPRNVEVDVLLPWGPASFTITWDAPLDAPALGGYEIFRVPSSGAPVYAGSATADETSFTDRGRPVLTPQRYFVRAYNVAAYSAPSNTDCAAYPTETPLTDC